MALLTVDVFLARTLSTSLTLTHFVSAAACLRALKLALAFVACRKLIVTEIALGTRATSVALLAGTLSSDNIACQINRALFIALALFAASIRIVIPRVGNALLAHLAFSVLRTYAPTIDLVADLSWRWTTLTLFATFAR